jgi:8-oxo-dGTP diphosphatase
MVEHAVVAVVNYQDKILLGKKRRDSLKFLAGEWHIPGETVEDGELDQEALKRGIKEETGLEITVGRYLGNHTTPTSQREIKWYECYATTDKVVVGSDLEDIRWVKRNEVLIYCSPRAIELLPEEIQNYFR